MQIEIHHIKNVRIAEIISPERLISSAEDGLNLLGDLYYKDFDKIIINENNLHPDFFDLKNGMAGEILQKFSNYRVALAIVGDFKKYPGKSLNGFIEESNRGRHINFVNSRDEALKILSVS
ncbi:MAG TPA: DUF4180 domain-containing protein [Bacteroidia bacterium]|nr:DUF4180 domain-containing protein [Bacteroidia bacterium]